MMANSLLKNGLWPTWRWMSTRIKENGVTIKDFISRSGIPAKTFQKVREKPDRPVPFTAQWKQLVSDMEFIINSIVKEKQSISNSEPVCDFSELFDEMQKYGVSVAQVARESGMPNATASHWKRKGRIPKTERGNAFVTSANRLIFREKNNINSVKEKPNRINVTSPSLCEWNDIIPELKSRKISIIELIEDAGYSGTLLPDWRACGYIPDTPAGKAFLRKAREVLENGRPDIPRGNLRDEATRIRAQQVWADPTLSAAQAAAAVRISRNTLYIHFGPRNRFHKRTPTS